MKAFRRIIIAACMMLLITEVSADEVVIIVNAKNTQDLSLEDIKNIYADRVVRWDNGNKIKVLNLPVDSTDREAFSREVLGITASEAVVRESNRKITNRIQNPTVTKRDSLISSIVSRSTNAIGYVSKRLLRNTDRIRIIHTLK